MERKDKFGNFIYNKTWNIMLNNAIRLKESGFMESKKKSNLFYKHIDDCIIFADMRGTDVVPIWEDTDPLIYFKYREDFPMWKQIRIKRNELNILKNNSCPYRFSFYECEEWVEAINDLRDTDNMLWEDDRFDAFYNYYNQEFSDGYCKECLKDCQYDTYHCSKECRIIAYRKLLAKRINEAENCEVCKKKIVYDKETIKKVFDEDLPGKSIEHHINYAYDKTMHICASCHAKIHRSNNPQLKKFRPHDNRPQPTKKFKLIPCHFCHRRVRVPINLHPDKDCCSRCRPSKKKWGINYLKYY